jgi:hypothetical protein
MIASVQAFIDRIGGGATAVCAGFVLIVLVAFVVLSVRDRGVSRAGEDR